MGITHLSGLEVAGVPTMGMNGLPASTGNFWFVNSVTGSDGNTGAADNPFATIGQAITSASADNGDVIVCTAGHAQTITTAGGITINKSGLTLIGLGEGADAPTLTFTTSTAATFLITSANFQLSNFIVVCNIASQVTVFSVQAANVSLSYTHKDTSSAVAALRSVLTTAAANQFTLNLTYLGFTANAINVNAVRLVGGSNANITVDYYGAVTTAIVEFLTTPVVNAQIQGYFYTNGTSNFSKDVVDTAGSSTWVVFGFDGVAALSFDGGSGKALAGNDVSTVIADLAVPTADVTTNALERDVIGNKTDAAVYALGTTKSLAAYSKGSIDLSQKVAFKAAALLVNGTTIFTVTGGPVRIISLAAVCVVGGDATAATLQFSVTPTSGSAQTISAASSSLANAASGASVTLAGTALATAALYNANGPNLIANPGTIFCPAGTITMVIGSGPTTTGTWAFYMRYEPIATGVTVA